MLQYYPPNINRSRCCEQAICTECFVQIKRAEPTTTHLVSAPAACPYCVRENFGVVYTPPPWRAGIGADSSVRSSPASLSPHATHTHASAQSASASRPDLAKVNSGSSTGEGESSTRRGKRKSYSHTSPEVVTVGTCAHVLAQSRHADGSADQIRPDWEAKLTAVRAAVTRRANRRIIMRQVGDRLIPVGVTSGRVHPNPAGGSQLDAGTVVVADNSTPPEGGQGRRGRRGPQNQDLSQLLGGLTIAGQDLEEVSSSLDLFLDAHGCCTQLMIMEAMRLSLLDHEEQQRRERETANRAATSGANSGEGAASPGPTSPVAVPSPRRSAPPSHQGSPLPPSGLPGTSPGNISSSVLSSALGRAALSGALAIGLPSGEYSRSRQDAPQIIPIELPTLPVAEPAPSAAAAEPAVAASAAADGDSPATPTHTDLPTPSSVAGDLTYQQLLSNPPTSASDSMPLLPSVNFNTDENSPSAASQVAHAAASPTAAPASHPPHAE